MESKIRYAKYAVIALCLPAIVIFGGTVVVRISNNVARFYPVSTLMLAVIVLVCLFNIMQYVIKSEKITARKVFIANLIFVACVLVTSILSTESSPFIVTSIAALPSIPLGIIAKYQQTGM